MDRIMLISRDMQLGKHLREVLHRDYHLELFADAAEAVRRATSTPFGLVIADRHAAGLNCDLLLTQLRRCCPNIASLTLCRIEEAPSDIEGMSPVSIDRVLTPPYGEIELKRVVRQALKAGELRLSLDKLSSIRASLRGLAPSTKTVGAMAKLEAKYPGITKVEWDDSNSTYQATEWSTGFSPLLD